MTRRYDRVITTVTIQDATTEPFKLVRRMESRMRAATIARDFERELKAQDIPHSRPDGYQADSGLIVIELRSKYCKRVLVTLYEVPVYSRNLLNLCLVGSTKSALGIE